MRQFIFIFLLLLLGPSVAVSQQTTTDAVKKTADDFRKLIVAEAADFGSRTHQQAIEIVQDRGYSDASFDDAIRKAMKIDDSTKNVFALVMSCLDLMPYSTLPDKEKVSMMLDVLEREDDRYMAMARNVPTALDVRAISVNPSRDSSERIPTETLIKAIDDWPVLLVAELGKRLDRERPSVLLCAVAARTKEHGDDLLPVLMKAARSEDSTTKIAAMASLNTILEEIENHNAQVVADAERTAGIPGVDDKLVKYAERIVARYDQNKNGVLTANEWGKMLMSPETADANDDGNVSVPEFAAWMQSRTKRN